jgi:hypothetical protein
VASPSGIEQIDQFFDEIGPWTRAYRGKSLHYFGLASGTEVQICAARIRLQVQKTGKARILRIGHYAAGAVSLDGDIDDVRNVIARIAAGEVAEIRTGLKLQLPRDDHAGLYVQPPAFLHPEGLSTGRRLGVLTMQAANSPRAGIDVIHVLNTEIMEHGEAVIPALMPKAIIPGPPSDGASVPFSLPFQ